MVRPLPFIFFSLSSTAHQSTNPPRFQFLPPFRPVPFLSKHNTIRETYSSVLSSHPAPARSNYRLTTKRQSLACQHCIPTFVATHNKGSKYCRRQTLNDGPPPQQQTPLPILVRNEGQNETQTEHFFLQLKDDQTTSTETISPVVRFELSTAIRRSSLATQQLFDKHLGLG